MGMIRSVARRPEAKEEAREVDPNGADGEQAITGAIIKQIIRAVSVRVIFVWRVGEAQFKHQNSI